MKKLVLALGLCLLPSLAWAQNLTCPTRPIGDNSNACASTAFTQQAITLGSPVVTGDWTFRASSGNPTTFSQNVGTPITPLSNTVIEVVGANSSNPRMEFDAYTGFGIITGRSTAGTLLVPTATPNNQFMFAIASTGYNGTSYDTNGASILFQAAETHSAGGAGTRILVNTIPIGTTSTINGVTFADFGGLSISPVVNTNDIALNIVQSGPTSGSIAGPINLNLFTISSYNAATNAGTEFGDFGWWTSAITALRVNFTVGGNNIGNTEPFAGIAGHVRLTTASTFSTGADMEGTVGLVYANAAASALSMEGLVGAAICDTGCNVKNMIGSFAEVDIIGAGAPTNRIALAVVTQGTASVTGGGIDAGIAYSATGGPFATLLTVNTAGGASPIQTSGSFFSSTGPSSGAFTLANFINLPNMTVTGQLISTQKFNVRGTDGFTEIGNAVTPDALLTINGNTVAAPVAPTATTYLHIVGADSTLPRITMDAFTGAGTVGSVFAARHARGTAATPTATQANDFIFIFGAFGMQSNGAYATATPQINFKASENLAAGANGGFVSITTVPTGTAAAAESARFQPSGGLSVGTTTDPGIGGFIASGINATSTYKANGTAGVSTTCTETVGNTLVFTFGILTTKGANCT